MERARLQRELARGGRARRCDGRTGGKLCTFRDGSRVARERLIRRLTLHPRPRRRLNSSSVLQCR